MAKIYYPLNSLPQEYNEVVSWISEICRYRKPDDFITTDYNPDNDSYGFNFYTKDHKYRVIARPYSYTKSELRNGKELAASNVPPYLGATVMTRKPRAGEDWNRGNDLADGPYGRETWNKIKNDIIAYELVKTAITKDRMYDAFNNMKTVPETPDDVRELNESPDNPELNNLPKGGYPISSN